MPPIMEKVLSFARNFPRPPRGVSEAQRHDYDRAVIRALVQMRAPALVELAKH